MRNISLRFLSLVAIVAIVSLACSQTDYIKQVKEDEQIPEDSQPISSVSQAPEAPNPAGLPGASQGFNQADCSMSGIIFDPIDFGSTVDDVYDGPYLSCSYSNTGAHGLSENVFIRIVSYKADSLEEIYQGLKDNINGYIVQANEWNAQPDLSPELKNEITVLRDDPDGYIFMITKLANVQGCIKGDGYGVEKVNGKYFVQLVFTSCEYEAPGYIASMKYMQSVAEEAIKRVESSNQP